MQIVFVTQDLSQIAAFARMLVETTFHHTKLSKVGAGGSYRVDVFHGPVTGAVPSVQNRINEVFGKYNPRNFKLYKSHTMSESRKSGADERALDKRANFWRRWQVWAGLGFVAVSATWGVTTLASIFGTEETVETSVASSTVSPDPKAASSSGSAQRYSAPVSGPVHKPDVIKSTRKAGDFRVVGSIVVESGGEGESVALVSDGKRTIPVPYSQCQEQRDGDLVCNFDGQRFGMFGPRE
jgi:zona occludens toxin